MSASPQLRRHRLGHTIPGRVAYPPAQAEVTSRILRRRTPGLSVQESEVLASARGGPIATDPRDTEETLRKRDENKSELFAGDAIRYPDRAANRHCDGSLQSPGGRCAVHLHKFLLRFWNFIVHQEFGRPDHVALSSLPDHMQHMVRRAIHQPASRLWMSRRCHGIRVLNRDYRDRGVSGRSMSSLHLFELQAYFPQRSTDFHVYNLGSREGQTLFRPRRLRPSARSHQACRYVYQAFTARKL